MPSMMDASWYMLCALSQREKSLRFEWYSRLAAGIDLMAFCTSFMVRADSIFSPLAGSMKSNGPKL